MTLYCWSVSFAVCNGYTKVTAETEVWSTHSATLGTCGPGWSCLRSCMSTSSVITGYLFWCCREIFQSGRLAQDELHDSLSAAIVDSRGRIQEYCISWASTWCDQRSFGRITGLCPNCSSPLSRRRGSRFDGIRMTWPSQRSWRCSNRFSADSMLANSLPVVLILNPVFIQRAVLYLQKLYITSYNMQH